MLHPAGAELRLERPGRPIVFDPVEAPTADDIVVVTGPTRAHATVDALKAGLKLTVITTEPIFSWLSSFGSVEGGPAPRRIDGVAFDDMPYTPPARTAERIRDVVRRLRDRSRGPAGEPHIFALTFPDGTRLLHLDLALHGAVEEEWIQRAAARFGNADWTVLGLPHGETAALATWLPRFGPNRVLLMEMLNDERRELGLATELVTPARDHLNTMGLDVHVFATQASYRFE